MTARPRTVFLGSGRFAVPILDHLATDAGVELVGVVTAPPRPAGRGGMVRPSPVGAWARSRWLAVQAPDRLRDEQAIAELGSLEPELLVLADYGQIVPAEILAMPRHGALNLHPSLLPRHRGATPIPAAILAGDEESGVTLMRMDEGLDTGPIVAQSHQPLWGQETAPELEERLSLAAAALLSVTLGGWLTGKVPAVPQPVEGATLTRPLRRRDGRIDPQLDAVTLERQVRAYQPWPGSFAETPEGRLVVWRAAPLALGPPTDGVNDLLTGPPGAGAGEADLTGTLLPDGDGLALAVADGALRLLEVQLAGGRRMSSADLRRGHPGLVGSRVGSAALG
ncbi:MAG: methionyl-tRNA formyltransferase [Chloroflexi bacterium]|nr:methionyl-tRNA formyltransferase [Chloroflexota bacterium]